MNFPTDLSGVTRRQAMAGAAGLALAGAAQQTAAQPAANTTAHGTVFEDTVSATDEYGRAHTGWMVLEVTG